MVTGTSILTPTNDLFAGTYSLIPTRTGYIFSPPLQTVTVPPSAVEINFVAAQTNLAPVANAGLGQNIFTGDSVTLDGSVSSDPDGDALTYDWAQTGGMTVTLSNSATISPTFLAMTSGSLTFTLTVTDIFGLSDNDSLVISVRDNQSPQGDAGQEKVVVRDDLVQLDGSRSRDPDGHSLTYDWVQTGGPDVTLSNRAVVSPTFVAIDSGLLTFTLTVSDSRGLSSHDTVSVRVIRANIATPVDPLTETVISVPNIGATGQTNVVIQVPVGALTQTLTLVYSDTSPSVAPPPGFRFAGTSFLLNAYQGLLLINSPGFVHPITLTIDYSDADVTNMDEAGLTLRYRDGDIWSSDGIRILSRDPAKNRLVVSISHLTEFALLARPVALSVSKTAVGSNGGTTNLSLGSVVTYSITISNGGTGVARGVVLTDSLPTGMLLGGVISSGGTESVTLPGENRLVWGPADVPPQTNNHLVYTATLPLEPGYVGQTLTSSLVYSSANAGAGQVAVAVTLTNSTPPGASPVLFLPLVLK